MGGSSAGSGVSVSPLDGLSAGAASTPSGDSASSCACASFASRSTGLNSGSVLPFPELLLEYRQPLVLSIFAISFTCAAAILPLLTIDLKCASSIPTI